MDIFANITYKYLDTDVVAKMRLENHARSSLGRQPPEALTGAQSPKEPRNHPLRQTLSLIKRKDVPSRRSGSSETRGDQIMKFTVAYCCLNEIYALRRGGKRSSMPKY